MIKLAGETKRSFVFPADLETSYQFYHDITRMITFLPHIELLDVLPDGWRVRYSTKELNRYQISIICDLAAEFDEASASLSIRSTDLLPAIKPKTTMTSTTARGYFSCDASFRPAEDGALDDEQGTIIDYALNISGNLPRPKGLRLMPNAVISGIASGIATTRIREIADGFENNAIADFERLAETS